MSRNLMIDLETLAGTTDAVVLQVGFIEFDPITQTFGDEGVYDVALNEQKFRNCEPRTVLWWAQQSDDALNSVLRIPESRRMPVKVVLELLHAKIDRSEYVWARGPSFDLAILNDLAKGYAICQGEYIPYWKWRDERPMRDLIESCGYGMMRKGVAHNALDDAKHQAANVVRAYELMQTRKLDQAKIARVVMETVK